MTPAGLDGLRRALAQLVAGRARIAARVRALDDEAQVLTGHAESVLRAGDEPAARRFLKHRQSLHRQLASLQANDGELAAEESRVRALIAAAERQLAVGPG
ncbi:MAG TPA: PspA/IM30 family protein [Chloroflexota bacterium]|nr:PspA/IM30 family protein [Chloroflexota bacterium]